MVIIIGQIVESFPEKPDINAEYSFSFQFHGR